MTGTWSRLDIGGKPADVYDLAESVKPRFGILHLHGAGLETLTDRPAFTRLFDELRLVCVCPHGQRSWWGDRVCVAFDPQMTPERYLLQSVVPFFAERWGITPRGIGIQGISMGGQGALRLAFKYPHVFPVVAGIAAAIEYHELYGQGTPIDDMYDSKEQCRQDTAPMHIHPSKYPPHIFFAIDPTDAAWFRGNDRLHEKLSALGVPHEIDLTTRAGGHSWDYFNRMAERVVRFVHHGLEHESRRLL
ncbi:MAG TPA: alpha/beta hydrolase-fold protein [Gemmataceae bacterium]|nr:alpha/beta hydrolase-fold protein [Gemmataceae bacterium]